jgi:hypothetical protein
MKAISTSGTEKPSHKLYLTKHSKILKGILINDAYA